MIKRKIDPNHLVWKSEYNVGSYKVDLEHQSLFKLAKKALTIRTVKDDKKEIEELKSIIRSLYEYVAVHFKNEEKYMASVDFPELQRHKKIHIKMLETLHGFVQTINQLTIDEIEVNLYQFIEDYFIYHIVHEDMDIGIWARPLKDLRHFTKWERSYNTGNMQIDKEHRELFHILDEAFENVDDDQRDEKLKKVLQHLYDFMKEHFKAEEELMKGINFPQYEDHKKVHETIIESFNELLLNINNTDEKLFEKKLANFIDEHIVGHMLDDDKKIVEFEKELKSEEQQDMGLI